MTENPRLSSFLIVDDSGMSRMLIRQCIENVGFEDCEFLEARDGEEAWQLLQQQKVDLVLTDLNMPKMDGHTLLRQIKNTPEFCSVRVILITSSKNSAREAELMCSGASAVLDKPISPTTIYQALMSLSDDKSELEIKKYER